MRNKIIYRLKKIEKKHNIKILFAAEGGSRAYGLNDDNSDWDVRFIYVHKLQWYLDIRDNKNTIEFIDNSFDFSGWELSKAIKLIAKGNTQIYEWLNSPITYIKNPDFSYSFKELANANFNKQAAIKYYLALTDKFYNPFIKNKTYVDYNMYLKAIRPLLSGLYVQKKGRMPPTEISATLDLLKPYGAYEPIVSMLEAKRNDIAFKYNASQDSVNQFIEETMCFLDMYLLDLKNPAIQLDVLNDFLYKQIMEYTNGQI